LIIAEFADNKKCSGGAVSKVGFERICHSGFATSICANTGISRYNQALEIPAFYPKSTSSLHSGCARYSRYDKEIAFWIAPYNQLLYTKIHIKKLRLLSL